LQVENYETLFKLQGHLFGEINNRNRPRDVKQKQSPAVDVTYDFRKLYDMMFEQLYLK
jgi:hypothetical protein